MRYGLLLALGLPALLLYSQVEITPRARPGAKEQAAMPSATLRVDSNLVLVPTTVNDPFNRPITGLEKENFRVFDDKVEQTITSFGGDDEPIALGFIFDTSGSMKGLLPQGRAAASEFLKLADPQDEFFLVEFDNRPRLVLPLSADTNPIGVQVLMTKAGGSTALIDAVYMGIQEMRKSKKNKKALVLISDGGDNNSRYSPGELENVIKESDVLIYTVTVSGAYNPDSAAGLELMNRIAELTGAHMYDATFVNLPDIAQKISIELRNRYVLGYTPTNETRDGRYHKIVVKLVPPRGLPKLTAHWRNGYYAPSN